MDPREMTEELGSRDARDMIEELGSRDPRETTELVDEASREPGAGQPAPLVRRDRRFPRPSSDCSRARSAW
jgi:hypothetical protein